MQEIPAWFWMVIVTGISAMVGLILFYFAMLLKESMLTVREVRYIIIEAHDIIETAKKVITKVNKITDTVSTTVQTISESILKPVASIATLFTGVKNFLTNVFGRFQEEDESEVE